MRGTFSKWEFNNEVVDSMISLNNEFDNEYICFETDYSRVYKKKQDYVAT